MGQHDSGVGFAIERAVAINPRQLMGSPWNIGDTYGRDEGRLRLMHTAALKRGPSSCDPERPEDHLLARRLYFRMGHSTTLAEPMPDI